MFGKQVVCNRCNVLAPCNFHVLLKNKLLEKFLLIICFLRQERPPLTPEMYEKLLLKYELFLVSLSTRKLGAASYFRG